MNYWLLQVTPNKAEHKYFSFNKLKVGGKEPFPLKPSDFNKVKKGDIVVGYEAGKKEIVALGYFDGPFEVNNTKDFYFVKTQTLKPFSWNTMTDDNKQLSGIINFNQGTIYPMTKEQYEIIRSYFPRTDGFSRNRIIFGAPGTGKSYMLNQEKDILLGKIETEKYFERVTFHPDYSYANFVGTYKPVSDGTGEITYEYVPGPFMRVLVKALKDPDYPYLLIIEEINRANAAAVFGDVFQLLDRNSKGDSEYSVQASEDIKNYLAKELGGKPEDYSTLHIPSNMYIWATMNSADQGVFPMDTAFKRRWDFTYLGIDDNDEEIRGKLVTIAGKQIVEWNSLRKAINEFLANEKINEDKQLGPYFIPADKINDKDFCEVFKNKVLMYLFEDAAKQKRQLLFAGCVEKDRSRFSKICEEFDNKGIEIFNGDILKEVLPNSNGTSTTP